MCGRLTSQLEIDSTLVEVNKTNRGSAYVERGIHWLLINTEVDDDQIQANIGHDFAIKKRVQMIAPHLFFGGRSLAREALAVEVVPQDLAPRWRQNVVLQFVKSKDARNRAGRVQEL